ncbi:MAG TPA: hypothetical protein VGV87_30895 [Blastocatellia bacterium]|jgi:hypothetical protein|nr:hypothetical protein [Blastocatellia bacterium]
MPELTVDIIRYVDAAQPGWVECRLIDAWGKQHSVIDKVPIFTAGDLTETSAYPQPGIIACAIVRCWQDPQGRKIVTIDTNTPWGVESSTGQTQFDVLAAELTGF